MSDDVWQKLAKKGYLGTKAKSSANKGETPFKWNNQQPSEEHQCTDNCKQPCPLKKG